MKITCQACQAKYTIADEKIQGKIAKIRCRKCGATVLVDASSAARADGPPAAAEPESWLVSVAEGDQRTMSQKEIARAYSSNVISGETYVWKDGMTDWQPLAEVSELMAAIKPAGAPRAAVKISGDVPSPTAAPAAARREANRGGADLFAGGATEEEVATSVPPQLLSRPAEQGMGSASVETATGGQAGGLTGARDEHSVLFSLGALTGGTKGATGTSMSGSGGRSEDSGLIDLNALAQTQKAHGPQSSEGSVPTPAPFVFPAALGTVEVPRSDATPKSRMPMFLGGGIALAGVVAAVAILAAGRKDEAPQPPSAGAAVSAVEPVPSVAAATSPSASSSADPTPADSASAGARPRRWVPPPPRVPPRTAPPPPAAAPAAPALPPAKKNPCGCATGDLQCQIRCSATGH